MPLPEQTSLMYEEAWQRVRKDPWPCVRKLSSDLWNGFKSTVVTLPTRLWIQPAWRSASLESAASHALGILLLCVATALAIVGRRRFGSVAASLGIAAAGLVASLPIIWGDGGMRGTMIAVPFVVAFLSLPIALLQKLRAEDEPTPTAAADAPRVVAIAMLGAFVATGLGAFAVSRHRTKDGLPLELDLRCVPSVILTDSWRDHGVLGTALVPIQVAASSLECMVDDVYKLNAFVRSLRPGTALVLDANAETSSAWIVVVGLGDRSEGRLKIEQIATTENPYFVTATKWHWVD
jgi:hypothetical protein